MKARKAFRRARLIVKKLAQNKTDAVKTITSVVALLVSVRALMVSSQALQVAREGAAVLVDVSGSPFDDPNTSLFDLPPSMVPHSQCALTFPFAVQIDNLSLRTVSIRDVTGTLLLDGEPLSNLRIGERATGFYGDLQRLSDSGPVALRLPYTLKDGESIDIITSLGWPLEEAPCEAIPRIAKQAWLYGPLRLSLVKAILASEGLTLGWGRVEYVYSDSTATPLSSFPPPQSPTPSRLVLRIEVITSFGTHHLETVDLR
jgi:hypothetical protein